MNRVSVYKADKKRLERRRLMINYSKNRSTWNQFVDCTQFFVTHALYFLIQYPPKRLKKEEAYFIQKKVLSLFYNFLFFLGFLLWFQAGFFFSMKLVLLSARFLKLRKTTAESLLIASEKIKQTYGYHLSNQVSDYFRLIFIIWYRKKYLSSLIFKFDFFVKIKKEP